MSFYASSVIGVSLLILLLAVSVREDFADLVLEILVRSGDDQDTARRPGTTRSSIGLPPGEVPVRRRGDGPGVRTWNFGSKAVETISDEDWVNLKHLRVGGVP